MLCTANYSIHTNIHYCNSCFNPSQLSCSSTVYTHTHARTHAHTHSYLHVINIPDSFQKNIDSDNDVVNVEVWHGPNLAFTIVST